MRVVSYKNVVPTLNKSYEKEHLLMYFVKGVQATGDNGRLYEGYDLQDCEVAVIQGWQHDRGKNAKHLQLRQNIIDHQIKNQKYVVTADSNLFLYANKSNTPYHYLRYSFNGIFPTTGIYCDTYPDPKRWQQISEHTGIRLNDYTKKGMNILLCCQRNGGWSMGEYNTVDWINDTVNKIRQHSDRKIVIRSHPGDKRAKEYMWKVKNLPNVKISIDTTLEQDLHKAWAVVNHNSSSIVGPIIQGFHAFITDPKKSQCKEVCNTDFSKIENPEVFDREKWLHRISMFHWNFQELQDGTCWKHMRQFVNV